MEQQLGYHKVFHKDDPDISFIEDKIQDEIVRPSEGSFCDYLHSCIVRGNKLCLDGNSHHCSTKRFYEKWGTNYKK